MKREKERFERLEGAARRKTKQRKTAKRAGKQTTVKLQDFRSGSR
jgi:hypothetical protein